MSTGADSLKSIFFALAAGLVVALSKLLAALFTGSGVMLAEASHSLVDTVSQLLLLLGLRSAKRPPTDQYPLGYGKAVYFWSFVVALILYSMAGIYAIYEGVSRLNNPQELTYPLVALVVLVFALVAEFTSLWGCRREVNKVRGRRSLLCWLRETRQSDLQLVFGEDATGIVALFLALAALIASLITGSPVYDAIGAIVIGVLLIFMAIMIGVEVKSLLIGQGVEPETRERLVSFLTAMKEVDHVDNLLTIQLGEDVLLAVKARMRPTLRSADMIADIKRCKSALKAEFPQILWLFFEPVLRD